MTLDMDVGLGNVAAQCHGGALNLTFDLAVLSLTF